MSLLRTGAGVEMTGHHLFTHRVRRLVVISAVALGVIWGLAFMEGAPAWILMLLGFGWVTMPTVLAASMRRPALRYALVAPATTVPIGLVGMVSVAPEQTVTGWVLITVGVLFGGSLGMWFWFRWLPVPRVLDDPFGWPRLALVGIHIALVIGGMAIVALVQ